MAGNNIYTVTVTQQARHIYLMFDQFLGQRRHYEVIISL